MRSNKHNALEVDLELTAQQLLAPLGQDEVLEVDDVMELATTCESEPAANDVREHDALQETSEIELTAEQMDAMLEGRFP